MVDKRRRRFACNDPPDSSPEVACKHCSRQVWPDREGSRAIGCPGCLYLSARSTWLSHLHVSPRPLYVARVGSPTVDNRSQFGGAHGRRYVCRLCYLAERAATPGAAIGEVQVSGLGFRVELETQNSKLGTAK